MASILFNKDNDPLKEKTQGINQSALPAENSDSMPTVKKEDDFAIFPEWDVVPPNTIINPRIKKNI